VFVDRRLRIARFTPAATPVINLIASDVGRPLEHVASNIVGYDRMVDDIAAVLEHLAPREAEVHVKSGAWYLMRIRPYRTMDNVIEGAVVTFVDISERKQAEESLRRSQERLNAFINQAYAGVCEIDLDGRLRFANDRLCEMLGYSRAELLEKSLADITEPEDLERVRERFAALARGGTEAQVERAYVCRNGSRLRVIERVSALRDAGGATASLLALSFEPRGGAAASA
jgi:two-component system CheB/CheR fusion protein